MDSDKQSSMKYIVVFAVVLWSTAGSSGRLNHLGDTLIAYTATKVNCVIVSCKTRVIIVPSQEMHLQNAGVI